MNAPDSALPPDAGWQPLPARARALLMLDMLPRALPAAVPAFVLAVYLGAPRWTTGAACIAAAVLFALWLGARAHRYARWRLDAHGLAILRGRSWVRETRVPLNRVQHLDIRQGPLQRARQLATLVVYTAGTRHSAVSLPHLDADDARRLRDVLGEQIDHDDA